MIIFAFKHNNQLLVALTIYLLEGIMENFAMNLWLEYFLGKPEKDDIGEMYAQLARELPKVMSVVATRHCNLQCKHCIFQKERQYFSNGVALEIAAKTIVSQMLPNPIVVHEGRIFELKHLSWLQEIRQIRPDSKIGMIDNGSYSEHISKIKSAGFKFDWLDISVDGPERIHNFQRDSKNSFATAIEGIRNAQEILTTGGEVNSLMTLTKINYASVLETCKTLPEQVSQWHITTVTPTRSELKKLTLSGNEFKISWNQIKLVNVLRVVVLKIYEVSDMLKLVNAVGGVKFFEAFEKAQIGFSSVSFVLDGVLVRYFPKSMAPKETFMLDADAVYRVPYVISHTLAELNREALGKYTIGKVTAESNFRLLYKKCVIGWRENFSREAFKEEAFIFQQIKNLQ